MSARDHARPATVVVLVLVLGMGLVAAASMSVGAHAYLSETDPENGEQLDTLPEEVTLTFSGDGVVNADMQIEGPDGEVVSGEPEIDPEDTQEVTIPLEEDAGEGMYLIEWEVLADDGHTTSGSFFFSVGDEPLDRDAVVDAYEADGEDDDVAWAEAAPKGLLLVALVGLVGVPLTATVAVYPAANRFEATTAKLDRQFARLLAGLGGLLFASSVTLGLARVAGFEGLSAGSLAAFVHPENPVGFVWAIQVVLAAGLFVLLVAGYRGLLSRRTLFGSAFVGSVLIAATVSWTSHSATAIDRLQGTLVDFGHIAGAGLWVGGLAVLALILPSLLARVDPADRPALAAATIRRYSLLALTGVTVATASGLVLTGWHVPSTSSLSASVYGLALSGKTLAVLGALGLGGLTRFVLLSRLEAESTAGLLGRLFGRDSGLRGDGGDGGVTTTVTRAIRLEVALLVVVLLLSGLLTSAPTAAVVGDDDRTGATIERDGDVDLELLAVPADQRVDADGNDGERLLVFGDEPIVFEVTFTDDGEPVASDGEVRLLATHDDGTTIEVDLEETDETGTYATVQTFAEDGQWELRLTGSPDGGFTSEWVDTTVLPAADEMDGDGYDHGDHDEIGGHDHGDHDHDEMGGHDHGNYDHSDHDDTSDSPFAIALQFGAVAIGVIGTVAVAIESIRFRGQD